MEHVQGQPGADRAVGRPGPAARMNEQSATSRPRPSVLINPVPAGSAAAPSAPPVPQVPVPAPHPPAAGAGSAPMPAAPTQAGGPNGAQGQGSPSAGAVVGAAATAVTAATAQAVRSAPAPARAAAPQGAAQPRTEVARVARSAVQATTGPRSARVFLTHIDPWSVMKQAFLLSLALAVVMLVAAATLWFALDSAGVLDAITRTATDVGGQSGASVGSFLEFGRVMGIALVVAGVETVLLTALATLFAFLYNLAVGIGGGLEVTLSEDDA
jgi:hypothetical protein